MAIQHGSRSVTYAELKDLVTGFQIKFQMKGFVNSKKVLVLHPLSIEMYAALLALLANACTLVFVEEWTSLADVKMAQQKIKCDGLLCTPKVRMISWLQAPFRKLKWLNTRLTQSGTSNLLVADVQANQAAIISFTSGTGSASKAVIRTHAIVNAQFLALQSHIVTSEAALMCTNFPVVILLNLGLGISTFISSNLKLSALPESNFYQLAREIESNHITHLSFSPFVLYQLCQRLEKTISLKQIICGGAALFPSRIKEIQQKISAENFTVLYGSSEAEPIAHCNAMDVIMKENEPGLYAGSVDDFTELKVVKTENNQVELCKNGEAGEVMVTGLHVVKNYMDSEQAYHQNKILFEGEIWHRTGDYAYFNSEQHLFLTGPLNQQFNGQYLMEIEKKLANIKGLVFGTVINNKAYIQMEKDATEDLKERIKEQLPTLKDIVFMNLPMDKRHHGKIKYRLLS